MRDALVWIEGDRVRYAREQNWHSHGLAVAVIQRLRASLGLEEMKYVDFTRCHSEEELLAK